MRPFLFLASGLLLAAGFVSGPIYHRWAESASHYALACYLLLLALHSERKP